MCRFSVNYLTALLSLLCFTLHSAIAEDLDANTERAIEYAEGLSSAFESIATTIAPSVVSITSRAKINPVKSRQFRNPNNMPEELPDLFEHFFGRGFQMPDQNQMPQMGVGTGIIVDQRGHILTNNHVIAEGSEITVKLEDGRELEASIIGTDPRSDLAVIKVEAKDLPHATLGDSDGIRVGEWVVAIGNPFGLDHTITAGIVSAKGRSISGGEKYENYIQTDAAINPGNSGGPLLNLRGQVIGINTAIYSRSGGYMGIGFAIPANSARRVADSLISEGKVTRGWLGVQIQRLTKEMAESFGHSSSEGALVADLQPDSPAEKAGMRQGDIIVRVGEKKIADIDQLRNLIADLKPKAKVEIEYFRDGKSKTATVTIGELKSEKAAEEAPAQEPEFEVGISVEELTPELATRWNLELTEGLLITSVIPGSFAADAGLQRGNVILEVNGEKLKKASRLRELLSKDALKRGVRMLVQTQAGQLFVIIKTK